MQLNPVENNLPASGMRGLDSIENIQVPAHVLASSNNVHSLYRSVKVRVWKQSYSQYLKSVDIVYEIEEEEVENSNGTSSFCANVLFFIRRNIRLNMKTTSDVERFLDVCRDYSRKMFIK